MNTFKHLTGDALIAALEDQAFSKSTELISRELTTSQVVDFGTRQVQIAEEESETEDAIKSFVTSRKKAIKELKKERKAIARTTRQGFIETEEQLYWIQDFDARQMVAYDSGGQEVLRRRMKPSENQGMVHQMKTA